MEKTLEQKANDFSNTNGTQSCKSMREVEHDTGRYVGYLAGFKDCQKEYEEKLRWIPIGKKLPEQYQLVLVRNGGKYHIASLQSGDCFIEYNQNTTITLLTNVTEWRSFL